MFIRLEQPRDFHAIHEVNASAFETQAEADLVDTLRQETGPIISIVAEEDGAIVGHILFSPVILSSHPGFKIMGLGPMAVLPAYQRKGIGSKLVRRGLEECRSFGAGAVVVLGHVGFYPRFGFAPALRFGITCEYDVPEDAFMVIELEADYLKNTSGTIKYHPAFNAV